MRQGTTVTTTDFVLDEQGKLPRILGEVRSGGIEVRYAYGPEGFAAQQTVLTGTAQGVISPLLDALGSVRHLTDAEGLLVRSVTYDAWGTVRQAPGNVGTRLGFTGEPMGTADGLVYLRARHYQPALGRFLERDTFPGIPTRPQSLHKYLYAENNPARYTDPSGKFVPLLIALWVADLVFTAYDIYQVADVWTDPCATWKEVGQVTVLTAIGLALPGIAGLTAAKYAPRAFRALRTAVDGSRWYRALEGFGAATAKLAGNRPWYRIRDTRGQIV